MEGLVERGGEGREDICGVPAMGELAAENGLADAMVGDCKGDCSGESLAGLNSTINGGKSGVDAIPARSIGSSWFGFSGKRVSTGVEGRS